MKFSIFTPTHRPTHLERLAKSVAAQTDQDFEWVIAPNGGVTEADIPHLHPSQRVIPVLENRTEVGYLKRRTCLACKGEILVEVDHDDELAPTALEELRKAFSTGADFVYSNFCNVLPDGSPFCFDTRYGWETRPCTINGKEYTETLAFQPSPAAFSRIWFTPNHVRAWRADFYRQIGGHNESMAILDDQELLCRTYLQGKVVHIDKPLYIYHIHKGNTCYGELNQEVQDGTWRLHDQYLEQLVERWCDLKGLAKVNLSADGTSPSGYLHLEVTKQDYLANETQWQLEPGSVGLFRAHESLHLLPNALHSMREIYAALAENGWLLSTTPSTDGPDAFNHPLRKSFWNSNSFWYYTRAQQAQFIGTPVKFQEVRSHNFFPSPEHAERNAWRVRADLMKFAGKVPGAITI